MKSSERISEEELQELKQSFLKLIGLRFDSLRLPIVALTSFEPSQIGTIVGSLMDALIPYINLPGVGLTKHEGILGEREGYPDYRHQSGKRLELKLLYVDNPQLTMKTPPTPREPSARLTQKVTVKNVNPALDALLLIAYRLEAENKQDNENKTVSPTIIDLEVLSMIELVEARDQRMIKNGGQWFGNYETPTVLSNRGKEKVKKNIPLDSTSYGRKESEGKDYNEDTNFGKLKRIPHKKLQEFLIKHKLFSGKEITLEPLIKILEEMEQQELQDEELN